jgi:hypothetical protein
MHSFGRVLRAQQRACSARELGILIGGVWCAGYAVQQRANGPRFTGGGFSLGA